jgi:hypothetical protein
MDSVLGRSLDNDIIKVLEALADCVMVLNFVQAIHGFDEDLMELSGELALQATHKLFYAVSHGGRYQDVVGGTLTFY